MNEVLLGANSLLSGRANGCTLRVVHLCWSFLQCIPRLCGPLFGPVCLASNLAVTILIAVLYYWVPLQFLRQNVSVFSYSVCLAALFWFFGNIVFHCVLAAYLEPFHPPPAPEGVNFNQEFFSLNGSAVRVCRSCRTLKPPRFHHCRTCNRCVYRMDHHCPFINNCVGLHNLRHFFLFLVWVTLGCFFVTLSSLPAIHAPTPDDAAMFRKLFSLICAIVSSGVGISVAFLCATQLHLIGSNRTTVENAKLSVHSSGPAVNPYDKGSFRGNWAAVFGASSWMWILPTVGRWPEAALPGGDVVHPGSDV
eukprot:gnl/Spiro4/24671_TR12242_c0_g1_i1.p1 gnl/Spiro4/24671_TR12242_c0_g1~~gnl/Spiro4/24671_TR12242_c0_g1_i1.p1  ORF type:complete len:307 (+),score=58.60 gnl/Spiro4/24671_TR12242_c0_g1_i1:111-1031(+)